MLTHPGGYAHCSCGDCGEVTMTTGMPEHEMCHACREAGCEEGEECQAAHTYCEGDERSSEEHWQAAQDDSPIYTGPDARDKARAYASEHNIQGLRQYCGACGQEY